jgi:hypothetical protein
LGDNELWRSVANDDNAKIFHHFSPLTHAAGGLPPVGHKIRLRKFIDPELMNRDEGCATAGTWLASITL